jgi:Pyruvate/2-oxoacid:ferredoxin oxidoreductase delta subunit
VQLAHSDASSRQSFLHRAAVVLLLGADDAGCAGSDSRPLSPTQRAARSGGLRFAPGSRSGTTTPGLGSAPVSMTEQPAEDKRSPITPLPCAPSSSPVNSCTGMGISPLEIEVVTMSTNSTQSKAAGQSQAPLSEACDTGALPQDDMPSFMPLLRRKDHINASSPRDTQQPWERADWRHRNCGAAARSAARGLGVELNQRLAGRLQEHSAGVYEGIWKGIEVAVRVINVAARDQLEAFERWESYLRAMDELDSTHPFLVQNMAHHMQRRTGQPPIYQVACLQVRTKWYTCTVCSVYTCDDACTQTTLYAHSVADARCTGCSFIDSGCAANIVPMRPSN